MKQCKINSHGQMQPVDSKSRYARFNNYYDISAFHNFKISKINSDLDITIFKIKNREIRINVEKQNRHFIGTHEYTNNRSYFICSLKELDELIIDNIDNAFKSNNCIILNLNKPVGVVKNENGIVVGLTKCVKLHIGKTGYHAVPRKENI